MLERALAIREKSLTRDHRDVARTLADLASTLTRMGQPARAQRLADRALAIWNELDAPDAPDHASVLALYAELQANRGDYAAAKDYYERALQIRAEGLRNRESAARGNSIAARAGGRRSRRCRCRPASRRCRRIDRPRTPRGHVLRSLPERQSLNYAAARPRGLNLLFSLSLPGLPRRPAGRSTP